MSAGLSSRRRPDSSFGLQTAKSCSAAQPDRVQPWPVAVAMAHGEVDFLTRKVDMMQRRGNAKVDAGMRFGKMAEPMHQPFGGEVR